jgi:hypothetical protein
MRTKEEILDNHIGDKTDANWAQAELMSCILEVLVDIRDAMVAAHTHE